MSLAKQSGWRVALPFIAALLASTALHAQIIIPQGAGDFLSAAEREARIELALIRRVVDLTDEQVALLSDKLSAICETEDDRANVAGRRINLSANRRSIEKIQKAIPNVLSPDQHKVYLKARASREKFRDEAIADALLEVVHRRLWLTDEQREAIRAPLARWVGGKEIMVSIYLSNPNMPSIPDQVLFPHLNDEQKKAWNGFPKSLYTQSMFRGQQGFVIRQ